MNITEYDMTSDGFEALVAEIGLSPVPEKFRKLVANVALLIEDDVSDETRRAMALPASDTLLGLYHGVPQTERGESYGVGMVLPDTITLYRRPIIAAAYEDNLPVRQVIEETIWHEVAHHFGLDEDAVTMREQGRQG